MTEAERAAHVLTLSHPADLLDLVPYLLGFHPAESLVLIGIDGCRVAVTVRIELLDTGSELYERMLEILDRSGVTSVAVLVYTAMPGAPAELPYRDLVSELTAVVRNGCLDVVEALLTTDEAWWSYLDPTRAGSRHASSVKASAAAAAATYAGLVAMPNRQALTGILTPDSDEVRASLLIEIAELENAAVQAALAGRRLRHQRSAKRAIFAAARAADLVVVGTGESPPATEICRFAVALADTAVRDAVWMAIDQGRIHGDRLWLELLRTLPPPYDAAPLFLYGWAAWRRGNGILGRAAAERAQVSDPTYTAAQLLMSAIDHGLDPFRTPKLRMPKPPGRPR
jgi:hypothetical protein